MTKEEQKRFSFIEIMLTWQGRINTTHLCHYFGISRQSASKAINKYIALHPQSLHYDDSLKMHLATASFRLFYSSHDFSQYQRLISQGSALTLGNITEISPPTRNPSPRLVQPILRAIDNKLAIDIGYTSLTSPKYTDRIIEPHSLIFDGLRWHVRAFCRKNMNFRDFVLSRFNGEVVDEGKAQQSVAADKLWHLELQICIQPDQRLSRAQQQVIIDDYQMCKGILQFKIRAALVNYVLKRMHLDQYQVDPCAQQIVLTKECEEQVRPYRY